MDLEGESCVHCEAVSASYHGDPKTITRLEVCSRIWYSEVNLVMKRGMYMEAVCYLSVSLFNSFSC